MKITLAPGRPAQVTEQTARNDALAFGCMALFLLPFLVSGVWAGMNAVARLSLGNESEALLLGVIGLVFGGAAAGGLSLLALGWRKLKEREARKAAHPDKPWLWEPEWASGRITDASKGTLWASWVFALLWNMISVPVGFVGVREAIQKGNPAGLAALLFPVVGAGILIWAIRSTLRYTRYGVSLFELDTLPGAIGGTLTGTVRVSCRFQSAVEFDAVLSCVNRVTTRTGKSSSVSERILWQEETRVRGSETRDATGQAARIPVTFRIPADARASDSSNSKDRILWRLKLSASVPGVDYESVFEVPVFHTAESEPAFSEAEEDREDREAAALAAYRQSPESRIGVTTNSRGTEIHFPAARNLGVALGSTAFTLAWTAILFALWHYRAPLIFPIVFGFFELILVVSTLSFWLSVSRVTVGHRKIHIAQGYLAPGRERILTSDEVADITLKIGMQAGERPYYDIVVVRKDGKRITAGHWVRDKREAEWLAATIKKALGLLGRGRKIPAGHDP